jgi:hypothetical protein
MVASMRNGSGDEYFILFDEHAATIKGFDHETSMSPWNSDPPVIWPGMYDRVPADFSSFPTRRRIESLPVATGGSSIDRSRAHL